MDGDPTPALTGRRRTRPTSIGCRNPWQPKPGRAPLTAAQAAVQTNRANSEQLEAHANDSRENDIGGDCVSDAHGQNPWQPSVRRVKDYEDDQPDREGAQLKNDEALQEAVQ